VTIAGRGSCIKVRFFCRLAYLPGDNATLFQASKENNAPAIAAADYHE